MAALKINGVGRMADNDKALLLICNRPPSDDEMRALHEWARKIGDIESAGVAVDRLDNLVAGLTNMTTLPDRIHVEALRGSLPEIAADLRKALPISD